MPRQNVSVEQLVREAQRAGETVLKITLSPLAFVALVKGTRTRTRYFVPGNHVAAKNLPDFLSLTVGRQTVPMFIRYRVRGFMVHVHCKRRR